MRFYGRTILEERDDRRWDLLSLPKIIKSRRDKEV